MTTKMKLALVLGGSLISGIAAAAPRWDANGDGTVDAQEKAEKREEMKEHRQEIKAKMLARFDTNKDGKLDKGERTVMADTLSTEAFKRLDTNGDGQLSLTEFKAGKKFFGHHGRRGHGLRVRGQGQFNVK